MTALSTKALQLAQSQIGVEELPKESNAGAAVEKYLKSVGLGKGYSWCMAFVYWCISSGGGANPLKKTAGVLDQWNFCKEKGLTVAEPQPGDIFIIDFGKGQGHTGFVSKVLPNGTIQTIEGNTNEDGSREGYKVCSRTRNIKTIKGFIRI